MKSSLKIFSVVFLGFVLFGLKSMVDPLPRAKPRLSAQEQAKQDAEKKQMREAFDRHQIEVKANDIKWEKIKWNQAKHFGKDEAGHVVPTQTDLDDSWFKNGRDGKAGLKDSRSEVLPDGVRPAFPGE